MRLRLPLPVLIVLAAIALVLAVAGYVFGADLRSIALEAGLPDDYQVTAVEADEYNGAHWKGGELCVWFLCGDLGPTILVNVGPELDPDVVEGVLLHEVAHARQWRYQWGAGTWRDEWDADEFAVQALCRRGKNGPEILGAFFAWWWDRGHRSDSDHGHTAARAANVRGMTCNGAAPESAL